MKYYRRQSRIGLNHEAKIMKRNIVYLALALLCIGVFSVYLLTENARLDTQPPEISFPDGISEFLMQDGKDVYLRDVTAYDERDGDVTASLVVDSVRLVNKDGTVDVTYAAFDKAGNVKKAVRTARCSDYESPRFSLLTSMAFTSNSGFDLFKLVKAKDMLDGDISHRVRITSLDETGVSGVGTHEIELRVSNSLGETVRLVIPVEVYASGVYDAQVTLTDYLVYLPKGTKLNEKSYLNTFAVGSLSQNLRGGIPGDLTVDVKSTVQPDVPGVYTVEYRVKQSASTGNNTKAHTGYAKLIVVVEG